MLGIHNARCRVDEFKRLIDAAKRGAVDEARGILQQNAALVDQRDDTGATALHYAAFAGYCDLARLLVKHGADINARDGRFSATPAGWAIEYLREMGGLLGIELNDFAHAIRRGDEEWVTRWLKRFPSLRDGRDADGTPFRQLAKQSGNAAIADLFR